MCCFIEEHFADVTLESIAAIFGYSRSYFSFKFRETIGHTFKEYLEFVRVNKSVRLLTGGKSVSETAYALGYSNTGNFSRAYKKLCGSSPSAIKKQQSAV